jgi:hypothetical protein
MLLAAYYRAANTAGVKDKISKIAACSPLQFFFYPDFPPQLLSECFSQPADIIKIIIIIMKGL